MFLLLMTSACLPVEIHSISSAGRRIQLDGFLLEWNKADAKPWGKGGMWLWDAINTKEGLTGYIQSARQLHCGEWNFTFLPRRLSSYSTMKLSTASSAPQTFFRTSQPGATPDSALIAEWIVPWDSISVDSSGEYQIGLTGADSCGDTLDAMIFTGHILRAAPASSSPWSKVYSKGIFLAVLLILLYYLQRTSRKKSTAKRKK